MAISSELMYAILAMDAYNRGYNPGILLSGNNIGTADIGSDELLPVGSEAAGFYAVAYEWNGERAGGRPGSRATFVSAKVAKTIDAPSGFFGWDGRKLEKSGPTRRAQTRPAGW